MFKLIIVAAIALTSCFFSYPAASHGDHHHHHTQSEDTSETEILEPNKSNLPATNDLPKLTESESETDLSTFPISEVNSSNFSLIPNPSEILLMVLIINPWLLYILRQKLHNS